MVEDHTKLALKACLRSRRPSPILSVMLLAVDDELVERRPIPVDAKARFGRCDSFSVFDLHAGVRDQVELRNEFEPAAVRDGTAKRQMQFHQEMRTDWYVEGLGHMRDLQPRGNAADAADIDLDDR